MKKLKLAIVLVLFTSLVSSCQKNAKQKQLESIKVLEKELYGAQTLDRDKGMHMIDTYVNFSKQYPEDTASAGFLFKSAEIAMNLHLGSQAITYYDKIMSNYSDYRKAPECLFLKAFVYENELNDMTNAEKYYKQFLAEYPTHPLAKDAEASIKYLGKSPEELVKMFQEMNKEKK